MRPGRLHPRSVLLFGFALALGCGPDPRPLECPPHPSFDELVLATDGPLPPATVIRVTYGSGQEVYQADVASPRQVVFCEPSEVDGGALPSAPDAGVSAGAGGDASGGRGGAGASDPGDEPDASVGGAGGWAGGLPALRCQLWTQGPATIEVEAPPYETEEVKLQVSRTACTAETTIELSRSDGGI